MVVNEKNRKAVFRNLAIKEGLESKHPKFVKVMKEAILETKPEELDKVRIITLKNQKKGQPVGEIAFPYKKVKGYDITINRNNKNVKNFPIVYKHETDHLYFAELEKKDPELIRDYAIFAMDIYPFNEKLSDRFSALKKIKNEKKLKMELMIYVDEFHSETGEAKRRIDSGLDKFNQDKRTRDNLQRAVQLYNGLHGEMVLSNMPKR